MKKIVIFAGFMGMLILGTNAMATPTVPSTYNENVTTAGQLGTDSSASSYPEYGDTGTKDSTIKIATTKYVDTNATTTQTAVSGLTTTATTDNTAVTNNGTAITSMISDRQVAVDVPTDCSGTNLGSQYSGCAYMVSDGSKLDDANKLQAASYTWYKIVK